MHHKIIVVSYFLFWVRASSKEIAHFLEQLDNVYGQDKFYGD